MKILFVTNSIPFPARHGVELPLQNIIDILAETHNVDLLVLGATERDEKDYNERMANIPNSIGKVDYLKVKRKSRGWLILKELFGVSAMYYLDEYDEKELQNLFSNSQYDVAWVSPIGNLGLVSACRKAGLNIAEKIALGHNDTKVTLYFDGFKTMLKGRAGVEWKSISKGLRVPWIWLYERRYLRNADLIHLQTELETKRLRKVLPKSSGSTPKIMYASNGKKEILATVTYNGGGVPRVLFMTHLARARRKESYWFLHKVWPLIVAEVPSVELWLVGSPPEDGSDIEAWLPRNVKICGYVEDLASVFENVTVSVLPTSHGTGWINRVVDSLEAGVPIVGCSEPLATISGLQIGVHALKGDNVEEFSNNVVRILKDKLLQNKVSKQAKVFSKSLPTWRQTVSQIDQALQELNS